MVERRTLENLDFSQLVRRGDLVCWGQGPAEPLPLTQKLMEQRHDIGSFNCFIGISWSDTPNPEFTDAVNFVSYCAAGTNRKLAEAGALEIYPQQYSRMADFLPGLVDVLLVQVVPGKQLGGYNLALACEYLVPLVKSARLVIAELNAQAPIVAAEDTISAEDIDILIETDRALPHAAPMRSGSRENRIAHYIAGLVEDGATLQVGLGAIPETVLPALAGHRNLGVHSGLVSNSVVDLIECGVVNNSRKPNNDRSVATGLLAGSGRLNSFAQHYPDQIRLCSTSFTHKPSVLAGIDRFTAINSAVEVDLFGQVNAEMVGSNYVGAVGGLPDFMRGALNSSGGLPITALRSVARTGDGGLNSKIVARLNGPATLPHADAGIIVTEYGVADLRNQTLAQRARRLIAIAHPDFKEELEQSAWRMEKVG